MNIPKFKVPTDRFDGLAVFAVEDGCMKCYIGNNEPIYVSSGELIVCPPNVDFHKEVVNTISMCLFVYSADAAFPGFFPNEPIIYSGNERFISTLATIKRIITSGVSEMNAYKSHLADEIWYQICGFIRNPLPDLNDISDPEVKNIAGYLNANFRSRSMMSVGEIVGKSGYSHLSIIRKFKKSINMTPNEYIIMLRLTNAKRLLSETDLDIKEIAVRCGYENEYYFSNAFKKSAGLSPTLFRKKHMI